jgi:methyl coenzyme M reductase gamma subunit
MSKEKPAPLKLDEVENAERFILNIVQKTKNGTKIRYIKFYYTKEYQMDF